MALIVVKWMVYIYLCWGVIGILNSILRRVARETSRSSERGSINEVVDTKGGFKELRDCTGGRFEEVRECSLGRCSV